MTEISNGGVDVGAGTTKKTRKHWKRVNVRKTAYSQDYAITADEKCIGYVYYVEGIEKPVVQIWKENVERIEVKTSGVSMGKVDVREIKTMTVEDAEAYMRKDCPYCVKNYEYAKANGWRVIVDVGSRDIIGVEVPIENTGGN